MCMKKLLYTVIILAIGLSVFSCNPAGEDESPVVLLGQSIQVPNAEGQVGVALEFDDSWKVTGTEGDWFYVSGPRETGSMSHPLVELRVRLRCISMYSLLIRSIVRGYRLSLWSPEDLLPNTWLFRMLLPVSMSRPWLWWA